MKKLLPSLVLLFALAWVGRYALINAEVANNLLVYLPIVYNNETITTVPAECNSEAANYLGSYAINDTGFGTQVNTVVDCSAKTRMIESNALPNHETGDFPNPGNPNTISAQDKSWSFTTEPTFVGTATFAREPGVAINGVKFEPDTAERVTCTSGETYNIEAIQDVTDLGLDFNNAHVQPTGEYHYHGVSDLLVNIYSMTDDLVHVAFAADGHLIYYSKSAAYQTSYRLGTDARAGTNCTYTPGGGGETITFDSVKDGSLKQDWDYNASYGQLDECNGITINGQYAYLITDDYPYLPRCLMGEVTETGPGGGGGPGTPTECNSEAANYVGSYAINDTGFGTQVNTVVDCSAETRMIESNALPNHETGDFPNPGNPNTISAQDKSWTFTTEPTFVGTATFAREPGVAINGVKFEPDTAERVTCTSGETYNIEAIQDVTDLGLDFNNAHVQPTGEYHYHGVSDLLVNLYSMTDDLVHVAFAADGHLIYYSKSAAYQTSYRLGTDARAGTSCTYTPGGGGETITFGSVKDGSLKQDWDYNASYGQLDECNGITIDGQYTYLITDDYPYLPRCLMGEVTETGPGGGGGPGGPPPGP